MPCGTVSTLYGRQLLELPCQPPMIGHAHPWKDPSLAGATCHEASTLILVRQGRTRRSTPFLEGWCSSCPHRDCGALVTLTSWNRSNPMACNLRDR
jgi:hypothetical protein